MKSMKFLSFSMVVCMICLLTMTSCSAAEVPAANKNWRLDRLPLTLPGRLLSRMFPLTPSTLGPFDTARERD